MQLTYDHVPWKAGSLEPAVGVTSAGRLPVGSLLAAKADGLAMNEADDVPALVLATGVLIGLAFWSVVAWTLWPMML